MTALPRIVIERCHYLARCSEESGAITRPFASEAMRCAHGLVGDWMREAGMEIRHDNIGNLRGRYEGGTRDGATLLFGSHLDSVRNAGRYDGPLGVIVAIAAVQRLKDAARRLPFAVEVLAFADEEGLRFGSTYLGSRAIAGTFDRSDLDRTDAGGILMREAIRAFGGDPERIDDDRWQGGPLLGYLEVHIEQGPTLEARGLPVGVVSGISGQNRYELAFKGQAGHAGTVPMDSRRDALVAASQFVLAVEAHARSNGGLVSTVGKLSVLPGAANVIPGEVTLSLDVRHPDDAQLHAASTKLLEIARQTAKDRAIALAIKPVSESSTVPCAPLLVSTLSAAVQDAGQPVVQLASGAGHDAVAMSALTDVGMLFVRCKGGVSHNPAESVTTDDVAVAINVLSRCLDLLAQQ